jgi:hypothetical protein
MKKRLIPIPFKLLNFHYIIQLVLISVLLLFFKLYFEDVRSYQKFKIVINDKALDNFHERLEDNFQNAEYLYDLILPLPQQKYNEGRADYLNLIKDYFLFLKDEFKAENFGKLSSLNKKIYENSEFNFIQLVLSSYKKDFIDVILTEKKFAENDFKNFLTETINLYKKDIFNRQLKEFNKIDEEIIRKQKYFDATAIKQFVFGNPKYSILSNNDIEIFSDFLIYEKIKFQILLYENSIKSKNFINYYNDYFLNLNLFKIDDFKIQKIGANKKILVISILLLLFLIFYLELKKWKKKTITLI